MYAENYTTVRKETDEGTHKWKNTPFSRIEIEILLQCPNYLMQAIDSMHFLSKFQCNCTAAELA